MEEATLTRGRLSWSVVILVSMIVASSGAVQGLASSRGDGPVPGFGWPCVIVEIDVPPAAGLDPNCYLLGVRNDGSNSVPTTATASGMDVDLEWGIEDDAPLVDHFNIYRGRGEGPATMVARVDGERTWEYRDHGAMVGVGVVWYVVEAVTLDGEVIRGDPTMVRIMVDVGG